MTTDIDNERKSGDGYKINCMAQWMGGYSSNKESMQVFSMKMKEK